MRIFGVKLFLNKIFLLEQYPYQMKLLSFVSSRSVPVISSIFNLNREVQTGGVQDLNGADWQKFSASPMLDLFFNLKIPQQLRTENNIRNN